MSVEQAAYDALCHVLALRAEELAELRAENERLRWRGTAAMTTYKLCGCEDERSGRVSTWITRDGERMSSEEIVQTLTEQEAGIERLRSELAFEMEWVATAEHALCAFNTVMQRLLNLIEEFRAHQARGDFEGRACGGRRGVSERKQIDLDCQHHDRFRSYPDDGGTAFCTLCEIERLRAALFCKRCDGTGQWFCGVADTWLDCDDCEANAIRREAARAAGGEA